MKDSVKITVIFNSELTFKTKKEIKKIIYSKNSDEKKKNKLAARLEKRAAEDSVRFRKRKLSRLFNPLFNGYIMFPGEKKLDEAALIYFAGLFFEKLEKDFAVNIINYTLNGAKDFNFFEFEVFNYNFDEHKAIKSEFVKPQNIRKIVGIAESILEGSRPAKSVEKAKKAGSTDKKTEPEKPAAASLRKSPAEPRPESYTESYIVKPVEVNNKEEFTPDLSGAPEICEAFIEGIGERISAISLSWSLLSPAENIPVLETGEPVEIFQESLVRIYFQKPNVRQVVWRFRKKPDFEGSKPILRVYEGGDMLWYETLDGLSGSRYIIFPEDFELSRTWVEIGYLNDKGEFIFIARSPVWPPSCLLKKLPKLNLERKIREESRLIGLGATESLSAVNPGGGFSGSGADIK
ncbi:MAG: hypothetical protein ACYDDB_00990 [bacterium]